MEAWQERVVSERSELNTKLSALSAFISRQNPAFVSLSAEDQDILRRQRDAMLEYSDILAERIERFSP